MQAESSVYSSEPAELQVWKEAGVAVSSATAGDGKRCPGEGNTLVPGSLLENGSWNRSCIEKNLT